MKLKKLLSPESIAVVGASEKVGFGGDTCRNLIDYSGSMERIYFVNPRRDVVFDRKCYHCLAEVPDTIDLLIICTPQSTVLSILEEGAAKGAGGAVVYASGYSEVGTDEGRENERLLRETADRLGIAVMGPNCAGYVNYADGVYPFAFVSEKRDRRGSVGIISQSGQLCLSMMDNPSMRFSYSISVGNAKCIQIEDYMEYLVEDDSTKVIGMYLEGIRNPEKFINVLRRATDKKKPIVILKTGRSIKGGAIAASHTGSLSGSDKAFDAVLNKYNAIRVDDLEELISMTMLLSALRELPERPTYCAMCLSGGETSICADVGSMYGIEYPDFANDTMARFKEMLPSYATPNNPLDTTTTLSYDVDLYAAALTNALSDPGIGMVIIGYTLLEEIADPAIDYMYKAIKKVCETGNKKPIAMLPFAENTRNIEYQNKLFNIGVPVLPPPIYAFKILGYLSRYINMSNEQQTKDIAFPDRIPSEVAALSEYDSKRLLGEYGVPVPDGIIACDVNAAVDFYRRNNVKLAMKVASADIMHKSDVGGVKLNIEGEEEVAAAFNEIMLRCGELCPTAKIDGVLISPMMKPGVEMIIGVNNDTQFGPMIMIGMGGVFVEIFKDVALYPAPLSVDEARKMVCGLKAFPLLDGARGREKCDVNALCEVISLIGDFAVANKNNLKELDINPLFVYPDGQGIGIADALIVMSK